MKNIMIIGFMGAGKTTVTARLSQLLSRKVMEMDESIAEREGMSIAEIFAGPGEEYFRELETSLIREMGRESCLLVSCGGGAVLREENVKAMKEGGCIVLLTARPETIYERVKDSRERPLLNDNMSVDHIRKLMEHRLPRYTAAADLIVETDGKRVEEICEEIISRLAGTGCLE